MRVRNLNLEQAYRDEASRAVLRAWRSLTADASSRRTLVACSGGADSTALAIILSREPDSVVLAHVLHDLRPAAAARGDRDAVKRLSGRLNLPFCEASVRVRSSGGNPEAQARRLRYAALAKLARKHRCAFLATAHQADDLVESVLMRLMRGAGPRGLAAMRPSRPLDRSTRLIRPMLKVTRADAERICHTAGMTWRTDATNADLTRLRAAIRARILPELRALAPGFERRVAQSVQLLAQSADLIAGRAASLVRIAARTRGGLAWPRKQLRGRPAIVLGELLRRSAASLGASADRLSARVVGPAVLAIRSASGERKQFSFGGVNATVSRETVELRRGGQSTRRTSAARPRRPSPSGAAGGA